MPKRRLNRESGCWLTRPVCQLPNVLPDRKRLWGPQRYELQGPHSCQCWREPRYNRRTHLHTGTQLDGFHLRVGVLCLLSRGIGTQQKHIYSASTVSSQLCPQLCPQVCPQVMHRAADKFSRAASGTTGAPLPPRPAARLSIPRTQATCATALAHAPCHRRESAPRTPAAARSSRPPHER